MNKKQKITLLLLIGSAVLSFALSFWDTMEGLYAVTQGMFEDAQFRLQGFLFMWTLIFFSSFITVALDLKIYNSRLNSFYLFIVPFASIAVYSLVFLLLWSVTFRGHGDMEMLGVAIFLSIGNLFFFIASFVLSILLFLKRKYIKVTNTIK